MAKAGTRVLIVEDEQVLQDVYNTILTSQGYEVATAGNGQEALDTLDTALPDVVLLDVFMPLMDGREFMRNLDLTKYPNMKIIVSSNLADKATIDEMIELGAHAHILKSGLAPNDLLSLIDETLAK